MDLNEVFQALRDAIMILSRHSVTFVETPTDDEGNEKGESISSKMSLSTFIVRAFADMLLNDYSITEEEIKEALKVEGEIHESQEVPTTNPWHIITQGSLK
jgi:hypothetical protein